MGKGWSWSGLNEVWLVEAKPPRGKYQPFCGCVGCKSKAHATDLIKDMKSKKFLEDCIFRVALYRRVERKR